MTKSNFKRLSAGAALVGLVVAATGAFAQSGPVATRPAAAAARAPAPAAAGPAMAPGPVIPGVCLFSYDAADEGSAVGKYVAQRMQQLQGQAQAELQAEQTALQTDARALEAQRASITSDVYQQRGLAINQRATALQRKADQRTRELQATGQKALGRIVTEVNPLLQQVYSQRGCGLLVDRNSVFFANPTMDVTSDVVRLLDTRITQFAFDREHLDQPAAAATAAPARGQ